MRVKLRFFVYILANSFNRLRLALFCNAFYHSFIGGLDLKLKISVIIFGFTILLSPSLRADDATVNADATNKTQQLLTDPNARNKAIATDPKAQQADAFIKNLTGNDAALTEEVYSLAADVFANVAKDCKGVVGKMKECMEKFTKNPDQFTATWTEAQKVKLKQLEEKLHITPTKN